jgi:phosphoribosylformylglycinamidine synthase
VTGGNVSLYNETDGVAIPPSPVIGMVGLVEDASHITRMHWRATGDVICVLGPAPRGLGGSEHDKLRGGADVPGRPPRGALPAFSLGTEVRLQRVVLRAIRGGLAQSAHDVSEGGLAVTVAECCLGGLGAEIDAVPGDGLAVSLFGELPPRVVVSVRAPDLDRLRGLAAEEEVDCAEIGAVRDGGLQLLGCEPISIDELRESHETPPFETCV